MYNKFKDSVKI